MIGDVLGSYRVVSRLGAGGMGTVWLADHQLLGSRVAIKVLLPEMSSNPAIVQRFFDEARAASRIQDAGICRVLDFGWHEGRAYLVMEHLQGETLADRSARLHLMPPVEAIRILQQCALAMAAAHSRGIVHRDLKPDNIFLVPDAAVIGGERIKILDFGIAKLVDDRPDGRSRTQTGVIMGTPAFMSPEQCRGAGGVDHRSDIYALGCVAFTMLCGRPPFIAPTAGDMIASHLRQDPPAPSSIVSTLSPEIDALVLRCLAKPAEERFQTMTEFVRAGAQLTGDNLSIETMPPMVAPLRTSTPEVATPPLRAAVATGETVVTAAPHAVPPVNTTLGSSSGETLSPSRPWRGGLFVAAVGVLAAIGVVGFVTTRDSKRPASPIDTPLPLTTTVPPDASVATPPDAAVAVLPDASTTTVKPGTTLPKGTPPKGTPPKGTPPKGTLSKGTPRTTPRPGAGSGSGSAKPYDPFADR
ncbi:MAG: protein kinase domain-containing protein [Kofleriaceae bacterium]